MKVVYYVATSLDGFIADPSGSVAWLDHLSIDHEHTGYEAFFETVDGLLMGRKTYEFVYDHGHWPYGNKPTWVCSGGEIDRMSGCNLQSECDPEKAVSNAQGSGVEKLWLVGGGALAGELAKANLLTHLSISVMPALLGEGIKLMQLLPSQILLCQEQVTELGRFTHIEYRVRA